MVPIRTEIVAVLLKNISENIPRFSTLMFTRPTSTHLIRSTWVALWLMMAMGVGLKVSQAQPFSDVTTLRIPGITEVYNGDVLWADFDLNGRLDLVLSGTNALGGTNTRVYFQNNSGIFATITNLPDTDEASFDVGDFNGDGYPDLVIVGAVGGIGRARVYLYQPGSGFSFANNFTTNLSASGVTAGAVAVSDYDSDGDPDIAIAGQNGGSRIVRLLRNDAGTGLLVDTTLVGVADAYLDWGDYDADGDQDLLFTGTNASSQGTTRILQNLGNSFLLVDPNLPDVSLGGGTWADYDHDGDLDVAIWGIDQNTSSAIAEVYRNDSLQGFTAINAGLREISEGEIAWGDYNNDGWYDLVLVGNRNGSSLLRTVELHANDQTGDFNKDASFSNDLDAANLGASVAWGDYDNDGRLDLFITGYDDFLALPSPISNLYNNTSSNTVLASPIPQNLQSNIIGGVVELTWEVPGAFPSALQPGLTYQVAVGTSPGGTDIISPLANLSNGKRRVSGPGGSTNQVRLIQNLPPDTYYWTVQSIGANYEGSGFNGSTQSFTVTATSAGTAKFTDATISGFAPNSGGIPAGFENAALTWGDIDEDGDLDFLATGNSVSGVNSYLFENQIVASSGAGFGFEQISTPSLPAVQFGDVEFADFDNDNDLDLAIVGATSAGNIARVYENLDGAGQHFSTTPINLPQSNFFLASLDWGDYDGDGDQDLIVVGNLSGSPSLKLYSNQFIPSGSKTFVDVTSSSFPASTGVRDGDVLFADFNRDGHLDVIFSGTPNGGMGVPGNNPITRIYLNDGNGNFVSTYQLKGATASSLAVVDLNNDQWQDVVISGYLQSSSQPLTTIYRSLLAGGAGFSEVVPSAPITGVADGSVSVGDYDDDGWADLLLTGANNAGNPTSLLYRNLSSPLAGIDFEIDNASTNVLLDLNSGSQARWADVDNDNKLDFMMVGLNGGTRQFKLYRNIDGNPNLTPNAPGNLSTEIVGFDVNLSWDAPSNVPSVLQDGLYYNVYLKEVGSSTLLLSPEAEIATGGNNGFHWIVGPGNRCQELSLTLSDLTPGQYQWTVQAIDQDWEGSEFATLETFTFEDPSFVNVTQSDIVGTTLLKLRESSVEFGDYDNDGDLDFVVMGITGVGKDTVALYQYDAGAGAYAGDAANSQFLTSVSNGDLAWGDMNNDNLLDLAIIGENASGRFARVHINFSGGFSSQPSLVIDLNSGVGLRDGAVAWGDYNNDGWQDLVIMGEAQGTNKPAVAFHRNDRQGGFIEDGALGVISLAKGDIEFGDLNNDGWQDIAITGEDANGVSRSRIYLNDKTGEFTDYPISGLTGLENSSLAMGDYNADGWLDLALVGFSGSQTIGRVYRNTGNFTTNTALVNTGAPIIGAQGGSIEWGDYDNDGYQDLIVVGQNGNNGDELSVHLYRYDSGLDQFEDELVQATPLIALGDNSDAAWGDYNGDGKLDLVMIGKAGTGSTQNTLSLFENINANPANTPLPPSNLDETISGYEVILNWDAPAVANPERLSYNVLLDFTPIGGGLQRSPMSFTVSGERKLVGRGHVHDTTQFRFYNLPAGSYQWQVQSIDGDYEGSSFSSVGSFFYAPPSFLDSTESVFSGGFPTGLSEGDMAWLDYDLDDDLDLLVIGSDGTNPVTGIYRQAGGSFSFQPLSFMDLENARVAVADIDGNQYPDIAITGENSGGNGRTRIYTNSNGNYSVQSGTGLPDLTEGALAFGDFDNDGDADLAVSGFDGSATITEIYANDGTGTFTPIVAGLEAVQNGHLSWVDFNQDQLLDLLVMGENSGSPILRLYQNEGEGNFTLVPRPGGSGLIDLSNCRADWADYNNDGFPDLALTGRNQSQLQTRILRNENGSGSFTSVISLPPVENGDIRWGDYDDDGVSELVYVGESTSGPTARIYKFEGGSFTEQNIAELALKPVSNSSLAWGDYNQDGKLDLALMGEAGGQQHLRLYRNVDSTLNQAPGTPANLQVEVEADTIIFSWDRPSGSLGQTFNLFVGSAANQANLVPGLADLTDGLRRIAFRGNAGTDTEYRLIGLPSTSISWGVQTIDRDFEASGWQNGVGITYQRPDFINYNRRFFTSEPVGYSDGALAWADYDRDGDLDLLVSGANSSSTGDTRLYRQVNGELVGGQILDDLTKSDMVWGDLDADEDLDLILMGESPLSGQALTQVFLNSGGTLSLNNSRTATLPQLSDGAVELADIDNDGDLDVIITGINGGIRQTQVLLNDGNGFYSEDPRVSLTGLSESSLSVGDFDRDGDMDFAICGTDGTSPMTAVYRNNGFRGGFTALMGNLPQVRSGSVAFGDATGDGFLDLLVSGRNSTGVPVTNLLRYDEGTGNFVIRPEANLADVADGQAAWADFNDDGLTDLALNGNLQNGDPATFLYLNSGGSSLVLDQVSTDALTNAGTGALAWGDLDSDGKIDLAQTGIDAEGDYVFHIYRNQNQAPNQFPPTVSGLSHDVVADSVVLSWTAPSNPDRYTYNIRLGSANGDWDVVSPASADDGGRYIVNFGNAGPRPSYRLLGLDSAWYYWQVQVIDPDYEGGSFSSETDSFLFIPPHFTDVNAIVFEQGEAATFQSGVPAYGDYDRDGDLDLAVAGTPGGGGRELRIYENISGQRFRYRSALSGNLTGLQDAFLSWRDVNHDGLVDLLAIGSASGGASTALYVSDGDSLRAVTSGLPDLQMASADWGDFDHDGREDLLLSGLDGSGNRIAGIWLNTGSSPLFQASSVTIASLAPGQIRWLDLDRDGYLDVFLAGDNDSNSPEYRAYRNDTRGDLEELSNFLPSPLDLLTDVTLDIADFDNNGYPDIAMSGLLTAGPPFAYILQHTENTSGQLWDLYQPTTPLPNVGGGSIAWGDYNDDGLGDLFLTGNDASSNPQTYMLAQSSQGDFVNDNRATNFLLDFEAGTGATWGDYNLDEKLDLTLAGIQDGNATFKVFRNDEPTSNVEAPKPGTMDVQIVGSAVRVLWQAPTGYPADLLDGLSYQLSIQEEGNADYFLFPHALDSIGTRQVVDLGVTGSVRSWLVVGLEEGKTYNIAVQSVTPDFEGSEFSTYRLDFTPPAFEWANDDFFNGVTTAISGATTDVADYDGDGDLDLVIAGRRGGIPVTELYRNDNGTFVQDTRSTLPQVAEAGLAWGDFNLDNLPDLVVVGRRQDVVLDAALLINQGDGTLVIDNIHSGVLEPVDKAAVAWGDYDTDGYPDVVIAGQLDTGEPLTQIYRNNQGETFVLDPIASASLTDVKDASLAWADFDGDDVPNDQFQATRPGKPDLLLLGTDNANNPVSIVYRNRGNGTFGPVATGITQVSQASGAWGLINNDEYPDMVITGISNGSPSIEVYTYDPAGFEFFQRNVNIDLLDTYNGSLVLGDYDGNGKTDLLVAGATEAGSDEASVRIYRNLDGTNFEYDLNSSSDLDSAEMRSLVWADFDGDGKLDIFSPDAINYDVGSGRVFGMFRNIDTSTFVAPLPPTDLRQRIFGNEVTLEWVSPDEDEDLTFNVYLQREGAEELSVSTEADPDNGFRRVVDLGNVTFNRIFRIKNLPDGQYSWSVQSIDAAYQGSPFAATGSFGYANPVPTIIDSLFPQTYDDGTDGVNSYITLETDTMVEEVIVHHKFIADSTWKTSVVEGSNARYNFTINLDRVDEMGIEYYYEVVGLYGFDARTDTHYTYRFYDQGLDVQDLRNGRTAEAYNIVTVPLQLEDSLISSVIIPDFGRYNPRQYRIFQYKDKAHVEFNEGADWFTPGEGTWIITRKARSFNTGPGRVVAANDAHPYEWNLEAGWNQVGNPYPYALTWSDIERANPGRLDSVEDFLSFNNGYEAANLIAGFRGGFIYASAPVSLRVPVRKNSSVNRISPLKDLAIGSLNDAVWRMPLFVSQGGMHHSIAALGMHPAASEGYDTWDASVPPRINQYLEVLFREETHPEGYLSQSMVPTMESHVWSFEVASNLGDRELVLEWSAEQIAGADRTLYLFDVAEQIAVDMSQVQSYRSFSDAEKRAFRVYFGTDDELKNLLKPDRIHLGQAYPNPTEGPVIIPFSLPEGADYEVELSIMDVRGRVMYESSRDAFPGGFQALKWNGRSSNGGQLPPGIYVYQIQVWNGGDVWTENRRLIIK